MKNTGYTMFETALGMCALAWSDHGVTHVQLPEETNRDTEERIMESTGLSAPTQPPPSVRQAIERIARYLAGNSPDLSVIPIDTQEIPPFTASVYEAARKIPPGSTLTYGELARRIGKPRSARAVGQALARNPLALIVPCHRVLASDGRAGGFSAYGGLEIKARLLEIEGIQLQPG
ncbi:MAG: methylated-DNA--[protein]-cysteine S-methyltransferase [Armatimonadetes bacterium]|nr:methylated-DNA--[protein]-cysteine S-methyltransferase [Armatimonadota bacterium]